MDIETELRMAQGLTQDERRLRLRQILENIEVLSEEYALSDVSLMVDALNEIHVIAKEGLLLV
jgi:hypothetical protein